MTTDNAVNKAREPAWKLLTGFVAPGGPDGERLSVDRVTETVGSMGMRPVETERIGTAILEALRKATQRGKREPQNSRVSVRVWARVRTSDLHGSSSDVNGVGRQKRRDWGFFLVERQEGVPQASTGESDHVVELYLYQERQNAETRHDRRPCL